MQGKRALRLLQQRSGQHNVLHLTRGHALAPVLGNLHPCGVLHHNARGAQHAVYAEEHFGPVRTCAHMLRHGVADARAVCT